MSVRGARGLGPVERRWPRCPPVSPGGDGGAICPLKPQSKSERSGTLWAWTGASSMSRMRGSPAVFSHTHRHIHTYALCACREREEKTQSFSRFVSVAEITNLAASCSDNHFKQPDCAVSSRASKRRFQLQTLRFGRAWKRNSAVQSSTLRASAAKRLLPALTI
ncbi:hypothetical protein MHYP_G00146880 [Metynnis hypsauchen]